MFEGINTNIYEYVIVMEYSDLDDDCLLWDVVEDEGPFASRTVAQFVVDELNEKTPMPDYRVWQKFVVKTVQELIDQRKKDDEYFDSLRESA